MGPPVFSLVGDKGRKTRTREASTRLPHAPFRGLQTSFCLRSSLRRRVLVSWSRVQNTPPRGGPPAGSTPEARRAASGVLRQLKVRCDAAGPGVPAGPNQPRRSCSVETALCRCGATPRLFGSDVQTHKPGGLQAGFSYSPEHVFGVRSLHAYSPHLETSG